MTEPDRSLRADAALDALLDSVKAPEPSPALWRRLSGPGALAALQRDARPAPRRPFAGWLSWLAGRPTGFAFASVLGLVIGYAAAGMMNVTPAGPGATLAVVAPADPALAEATLASTTAASWGTDEMGIAYAPGTAAWSAASDDAEDEDSDDTAVPLI